MELNYNSFSSKLYRWVYGLDEEQVTSNFCKYFWCLIFAYIIALPTLILTIPFEIYAVIKGQNNIDKRLLERISFSLVLTIVFFGFICLVTAPIVYFSYDNLDNINPTLQLLTYVGFTVWWVLVLPIGFALIMNGLFGGLEFFNKDCFGSLVKLIKQNIIVRFIKEKIKKRCPRINWVKK